MKPPRSLYVLRPQNLQVDCTSPGRVKTEILNDYSADGRRLDLLHYLNRVAYLAERFLLRPAELQRQSTAAMEAAERPHQEVVAASPSAMASPPALLDGRQAAPQAVHLPAKPQKEQKHQHMGQQQQQQQQQPPSPGAQRRRLDHLLVVRASALEEAMAEMPEVMQAWLGVFQGDWE